MATVTEIDIEKFTPPQRLELISKLWDSLDREHVAIPAWQRQELDRRLATLDADRENAVTWEDIEARHEQL